MLLLLRSACPSSLCRTGIGQFWATSADAKLCLRQWADNLGFNPAFFAYVCIHSFKYWWVSFPELIVEKKLSELLFLNFFFVLGKYLFYFGVHRYNPVFFSFSTYYSYFVSVKINIIKF